ncbi:DUF1080 domain-containing protein [Occallatibacter savannae]|uniref:DUF1080 domain-containing protein n=1 Tax=Occallatibacter savannae TaxID=1002691 RepID=UPI000D69EE05|nr:family 16 glycoside hydrolase [Occallatibacter savannae]
MSEVTRREVLGLLLAAPAVASCWAGGSGEDSGWVPLFDGRSLDGWKASEHEGTFKVVDGEIVVHGERSHLFYTGPVHGADFRNFEFSAEIKTLPGSNSGVYFHSAYQESGFPSKGFEVQVENNAPEPGAEKTGYEERKKTGSLYGVRNVYKVFAKNGEWFRLSIAVRGKRVQTRVNDMLVVDYVEPEAPFRADTKFGRVIDHGTFALQGHDPGSTTHFRNVRVRPLADAADAGVSERPEVDELYRAVIRLSTENYPVVDYHVHLKGGLTIEQALENSRRLGINYGIAINCGLGFPVHSDESVQQYLESMKGQPCFIALQAEGREWRTLVSRESIARFDYVFTDAMTFTDDQGKRMRLWIDEEVGKIADAQAFMDMYVDRIVGVMREPIDIYANPTFLPRQIAVDYESLWNPERRKKVIAAAIENEVAIEINDRYRIPSASFIKEAKAAGAKFSFGTNNADAKLGRLEYPLQMVKECGLKWQDIFVPRPAGKKKIEVGK